MAQSINRPATAPLSSQILTSRVEEFSDFFPYFHSSGFLVYEYLRTLGTPNPALFRQPYQVFKSFICLPNLLSVDLMSQLRNFNSSLAPSSWLLSCFKLSASQSILTQVLSSYVLDHRISGVTVIPSSLDRTTQESGSQSRIQVKTLYDSYYNVLQLTQAFGKKQIKRPLYSIFFKANFLRSKSIVILDRFSKFVPLRRRVSLRRYNYPLLYKGFLNQSLFTYSDNLFEVYSQGLSSSRQPLFNRANVHRSFRHLKCVAQNFFSGESLSPKVTPSEFLSSSNLLKSPTSINEYHLNPALVLNTALRHTLFFNLPMFKFLF